VREVFISLSRDADLHEGETETRGPTGPSRQIGETLAWWQVNLFDGRDALTVGWLNGQLVQHRVDQHLTAAFEALPFDLLRRIVEFKRGNDGLEIDCEFNINLVDKDILTSEKALSKPPVPLCLVSIQCTTDKGYLGFSCVR